MVKYRHRISEMYEFRDEATRALTPKSARPVTEATAPESWTFKHLTVSRSASVAHVQFKSADTFGGETVNDLRVDFSQLADRLLRDSKVLLDFGGVKSFCAASIDELIELVLAHFEHDGPFDTERIPVTPLASNLPK